METDLAEVLIEAFHLQRAEADECLSTWEVLIGRASELDFLMHWPTDGETEQ